MLSSERKRQQFYKPSPNTSSNIEISIFKAVCHNGWATLPLSSELYLLNNLDKSLLGWCIPGGSLERVWTGSGDPVRGVRGGCRRLLGVRRGPVL